MSASFRLDGRVALVTGAAGHLGSAISSGLHEAGAHVILCGRRPAPLDAVRRGFADPSRSSVIAADVADDAKARAAVRSIEQEVGALDIIVNNAYDGSAGRLAQASSQDFLRSYAVAVIGPFALLQEALPLLQAAGKRWAGGASVINIGSMYANVSPDPRIYGQSGMDNPPYYGAAKAGLNQLTRYLACHLGSQNIRVNCVNPGPFPPARVVDANGELAAALRDRVPLARLGRPEEIVGPTVFLASDAAAFVTGACLQVDGGWTAW